ncbi:hypothetical protein GCM10022408_22470 [Hymenobacter fastidiosus]|uniref:Uncharacterized protein n=1 Tax=Hymenobacter fastidiosus TaxID=486264 RepID=A0ABP7SCW7_9BACT
MKKWYSINSQGNYKEYISLDHAIKANGLVVIETESSYILRDYTNKYFIYTFYQDGQESISARIGNCQLISTETTTPNYGFDKSEVYAVFADSEGVRIDLGKPYGSRISGIANAVDFLRTLEDCGTFENYSLAKKVEELENRLQVLEEELEELKNTNE